MMSGVVRYSQRGIMLLAFGGFVRFVT
jgi:hypothetical protein